MEDLFTVSVEYRFDLVHRLIQLLSRATYFAGLGFKLEKRWF